MTSVLTHSLRHWIAGWLLPVLAIGCAGCSKSGPTLYHVRGKILFEGQPARGATVVLHPLENSGPDTIKPRAFVARDGAFEIFTYAAGDGAPAGEYVVTVVGRMSSVPGRAGRQRQGFAVRGAANRGPGSRFTGTGKRGPGMPDQGAGKRGPGAARGGGWTPPVELPARYQRPETSDLRIVVQPIDNDLGTLALNKLP